MKMSFKIFFLDDLPEYSYFVIYFFFNHGNFHAIVWEQGGTLIRILRAIMYSTLLYL